MQSTQLSLCAAVKKKRPNVPVFLIYAGIIHAIGLALLLPIMITLPGPGSEIAPETSIIDIEVIPATSDALTIGNVDEQTAALPSVVPVGDGAESGDQAAEGVVANAAPEAQAEPEANEDAEAAAEEPAKVDSKPVKKTAARNRTVRAASRRAKPDAKIAPFNGALTGLFAPGAPANRKR